jgi:hypothetical protein
LQVEHEHIGLFDARERNRRAAVVRFSYDGDSACAEQLPQTLAQNPMIVSQHDAKLALSAWPYLHRKDDVHGGLHMLLTP